MSNFRTRMKLVQSHPWPSTWSVCSLDDHAVNDTEGHFRNSKMFLGRSGWLNKARNRLSLFISNRDRLQQRSLIMFTVATRAHGSVYKNSEGGLELNELYFLFWKILSQVRGFASLCKCMFRGTYLCVFTERNWNVFHFDDGKCACMCLSQSI